LRARTSGARGAWRGHVALSRSIAAGTVRRMSSLNLDDFTDLIERPDGGVRRDAEARRERQIVPPGSLGRLDDLGEWLAAAQGAVPVRPVERPRVVLFAGDHGIAELGVSARPAGSAGELVRSVLEGAARRRARPAARGARCGSWTWPWTASRRALPDEVVKHRAAGQRADRHRGRADPGGGGGRVPPGSPSRRGGRLRYGSGGARRCERRRDDTGLRADRRAVRDRRVGRHRARRARDRRPGVDAQVRGDPGRAAAGPAGARGPVAAARDGGRGRPRRDDRVPAAECRTEDCR
jgi:hypothetical protein